MYHLGVNAATLEHLTVLSRDAIPLLRPTDVILILYANDLPANPYNPLYDLEGRGFPQLAGEMVDAQGTHPAQRVALMEPIYRRWPHVPIPFFIAVPDRANPWHDSAGPPSGLDPEPYREMVRGSLNPWLNGQSTDMPKQLGHDFSTGGSPRRHLMAWPRSADRRGPGRSSPTSPSAESSARSTSSRWSVWG